MGRKRNKNEKPILRLRIADWVSSPNRKYSKKIKPETMVSIRSAILNPIAWFKGADTPEGHVTPWELFIFALSSGLTLIASGFSGKQDFLYKEYYHISPNMLSVGGIISSLWDAANDPFLGSYMDRKRMGPVQWRKIMRISAVTGHCLNVIKLLDGGMNAWQHIAVLVICNCVQDVIGTLDWVAGQKLKAGISPYSQQRARTQVWTSVGSTVAYPLSTLPLLLMGLKEPLHLNDYQIIVVGSVIMLPFNIIASYMLSFIKQRVNFRPGAPINSLPLRPEMESPRENDKEMTEEDRLAAEQARYEEELKAAVEKARKERAAMLNGMSKSERKAFLKAEKAEHKAKLKNGEFDIDPLTGEPKLSVLESFTIVKHNKYFVRNTIANFITVFTPSVDPLLIYRYLVPKVKFFGNEVSGEMMWLLHAQVAGTFVTFTKPFSRQIVNFCGGPLRMNQITHAMTAVTFLARYFIGYNKIWKLVMNMLIEACMYVLNDANTVAETMLNYEMLDYVEYKTGVRTEGVTSSVDGLFKKIVSNNIGTVTGNAFLEWTGYTGGYSNDDVLPERFSKYMWPMYTLTAVFDGIVWLIARSTFKYSPEDSVMVEEELKKRRAAAENAVAVSVHSGSETED